MKSLAHLVRATALAHYLPIARWLLAQDRGFAFLTDAQIEAQPRFDSVRLLVRYLAGGLPGAVRARALEALVDGPRAISELLRGGDAVDLAAIYTLLARRELCFDWQAPLEARTVVPLPNQPFEGLRLADILHSTRFGPLLAELALGRRPEDQSRLAAAAAWRPPRRAPGPFGFVGGPGGGAPLRDLDPAERLPGTPWRRRARVPGGAAPRGGGDRRRGRAMGAFFLERGLVISRHGGLFEYRSRCGEDLYFECPTTGQRLTLREGEFWTELHTLRLQVVEAFASPRELVVPAPGGDGAEGRVISLADLPPAFQADVERKLKYITALRAVGVSRGQIERIEQERRGIAERIGDPVGTPSASAIRSWWMPYEKSGGDPLSLISGNATRQRGSPFDQDSEAFLQDYIDDHYAVPARPTAVGVHRDYLRDLKIANQARTAQSLRPLKAASERTFLARIAARPKDEMMAARHGEEAARHHFRMARGALPARYPLDVAEIDHSPLNLHVLDDLCYLPLGRPWIAAIKDRATSMLLGFYIAFGNGGLQAIFGPSSIRRPPTTWPTRCGRTWSTPGRPSAAPGSTCRTGAGTSPARITAPPSPRWVRGTSIRRPTPRGSRAPSSGSSAPWSRPSSSPCRAGPSPISPNAATTIRPVTPWSASPPWPTCSTSGRRTITMCCPTAASSPRHWTCGTRASPWRRRPRPAPRPSRRPGSALSTGHKI